ncbi:hypothetical protein HMPREF3204_00873 [Gardnerella pickettii]|nr:hypothetical protein HMPREF3204_00873 [Gardnerella pickettii]
MQVAKVANRKLLAISRKTKALEVNLRLQRFLCIIIAKHRAVTLDCKP